ncbi:MAG: hypothetical protein E3J81_02290 [Dehalococcoidia bacterium]|nr:MAG: hypothetical protein E3J81_02290 [Dehalococcoidia bacterium]
MPENETQETQENLVLERSEGQNEASAADELAAIKAQLEDEQKAKAAIEESLTGKDARIAELETALSEAKQGSEATAVELASTREAKDAAVAKYLVMAKALNPQLPEGIITGESIEEIDASVEKAKATVEAVKQSLQAEAAATKVPAGAPTRGAISLEGMSPREKIAYAISRQRRE